MLKKTILFLISFFFAGTHVQANFRLLQTIKQSVSCFSISHNGDKLISSSRGSKKLKLWVKKNGTWLRRYSRDTSEQISCVEFSPVDEDQFVFGNSYGKIMSWNIVKIPRDKNCDFIAYIGKHEDEINCISFSSDGNFFVSASDSDPDEDTQSLRIWQKHKLDNKDKDDDKLDEAEKFNFDIIQIIDAKNNGLNSPVCCVAFNPADNKIFVSGDRRGNIKIWETKNLEPEYLLFSGWTCIKEIEVRKYVPISRIAFFSDGTHFVTSAGEVKIWNFDKKTKTCERAQTLDEKYVYDVAVSRDGKYIATSAETINIWVLDTTTKKYKLSQILDKKDGFRITHIAFGTDYETRANFLVSVNDKTMKIWQENTSNNLVYGHALL